HRALAGFTTPTLDDLDFAINCLLVRPGRPRYPVLVHRAAALLHASSRRHLTMPPLRFANPSPSSGWIEDFHLQAVDQCSAHNKKPRVKTRACVALQLCGFESKALPAEAEAAGAAELKVDAAADDVLVERDVGRRAAATADRAGGVLQIDEQILDLGGPVRRECIFDAGASAPSAPKDVFEDVSAFTPRKGAATSAADDLPFHIDWSDSMRTTL